MAAIFGEGKIFGKLQRLHSLDTLWVENFDEIALSRTVKEIEANLCFAIFGKNSKIQNGRHFWGGENFWKIAKIAFLRYPVGRKFRRNHSISVKEIEGNLCFAIFGKNSKIQNGRHFWGGENFWKIANCNKFYCNLTFYKLNTYLILTSACLVLWSKTYRPTRIF